LTLASVALEDRAGNKPASDLITQFNAFNAGRDTAIWISGKDGRFDDPANWFFQRVPGEEQVLLPEGLGQPVVIVATENNILAKLESHLPLRLEGGAELEIRGEWIAKSPVVISNSSAYLDLSGTFEAPVEIHGGRLQSYDAPATFQSTLTLDQGSSVTLEGAKAALTLNGGFSGTNFTLIAENGAAVSLPQISDYQGLGDFTLFRAAGTLWQARGNGSRLTLPELTTATGPIGWNVRSIPSIRFEAGSGGLVELPKLTTLTGRTTFNASGAGSIINAPNLASVTGPESDFISSIDVSNSGEIVVASRVLLTRCNVILQNEGILRAGSIDLAENSSLQGIGTVAAELSNRGTIHLDRAPGNLVIDGKIELAGSSVLDVTIGLGAARTEAGRIEMRGDAILNGTLRLTPARGYTPAAGQQFEVGSFAKPASGTFTQIDDTLLGAAWKAELVISNSGLQIRIAARP
jgi:hypothetical protein